MNLNIHTFNGGVGGRGERGANIVYAWWSRKKWIDKKKENESESDEKKAGN